MKIAIDTRWIFPHISGIGAYTRALVRELAALDQKNQYLLLFDDPEMQTRLRDELELDRFDLSPAGRGSLNVAASR